jgi:hypothetical protein
MRKPLVPVPQRTNMGQADDLKGAGQNQAGTENSGPGFLARYLSPWYILLIWSSNP